MGLGSSAVATVRIEIIILNGKANRAFAGTEKAVDKTTRATRRAGRGFLRFRSILGTVTKALISMVAVLIAFNLLITLPQRIFSAFVTVLRKAIEVVSLFEQRVLALQAILATTLQFEADPLKNFIAAGRVAAAVVEKLALRANEMVVNLEEATIVFQTLVATGAQEMVKTMDELVDLTILLANSIAGITVGQQRQRQLAEETRSLMTGQLRATSLLGRLLFKNSRELNEFNAEMRITRTLSTSIQEKLLGFSLAARDFARTFEGLKTTLETFLQLLAKRALSGIFEEAEDKISALFDELRANQGLFNLLAATIASSFRAVSDAILGIASDDVGLRFDSVQEFLLSMIRLIPKVTGGIIALMLQFRNLSFLIIGVVQAIRALTEAIFLGTQVSLPELFRDGRTASEFMQSILDSAKQVRELFKSSGVNLAKFLQSLSGSVEAQRMMAGILRVTLAELERIREEQRLINEAQNTLNTLRRVDLTIIIGENSELLKRNRLIRQSVSSVTQLLALSRSGALSAISGVSLVPNAAVARSQALKSLQELQAKLGPARVELAQALDPSVLSDPDQIEKLTNQIVQLQSAINATAAQVAGLQASFASLADTTVNDIARIFNEIASGKVLQDIFETFEINKLISSLGIIEEVGGKLMGFQITIKDVLVSIKEFITSTEGLIKIFSALGNAVSDAVTKAFEGTKGFGEALKEIFGSFITLIGQALIELGVSMVAMGTIGAILGVPNAGKMIVAGLIAMATGAGLIALGVKLSGGGGGGGGGGAGAGGGDTPTFSFEQSLVDVQQAFIAASDNLNESSAQLQSVTDSFTSMPPSEVILTGNDQLGGASRVLAIDLRKGTRASANRDIALSLKGRG